MRKQKTNSNPRCGGYMMPDIAYLFVMDRMKGTNRATAEPTFAHLVSTTDDARKERRTIAAACKSMHRNQREHRSGCFASRSV